MPHAVSRNASAEATSAVARDESRSRGLAIARRFTVPERSPWDEVQWERRTASITGEGGQVVFEQRDVEVPVGWSVTATNIVVSKYFNGALGTSKRETSVRQLVDRVASTLRKWGEQDGYFASSEDADTFYAELVHLMVNQKMAFNSPVWFNMGVEPRPQCSACFINSVEDRMESILELCRTEGMLFKFGSGTGTNLSPLRSSKERLATGGTASGPVSFMKGFDAFAGVIKSGGKTRRAAKMVILNIDHPDVMEFIHCKASEEKKAWALIDAGYDGSFNGEAYSSVFFQNSNNSVRVTDTFMQAVEADGPWTTHAICGGQPVEALRARDMYKEISEAAWVCGDPGMQFDTTVNEWHTCPNTARINASNPCSEYMFLDDSACNLASLNLMKFRDDAGEFDTEAFSHAVTLTIMAQEIIVDRASYPTRRIERNSHDYRPLGLGYANLGALLMARGVPYDSDEGRAIAGGITALMTGQAYATSAEIAAVKGPFAGYEVNAKPMLRVIAKHGGAVDAIDARYAPAPLIAAARNAWRRAYELGEQHGFKNAQATVLAPTGTIGFMMDCDTTGVEPDIALVKYKKLVGGGFIKIVNQTVPEALRLLGYVPAQVDAILRFIDENDTIEGAPELKPEHLPVFDCAFRAQKGVRSITYQGHIRMMAAAQPFISGAISKTVNLPTDASPADIQDAYTLSWKLGLKAIAVYRDGCKRTQPLNTGRTQSEGATSLEAAPMAAVQKVAAPRVLRRRLPDERQSITHKFSIAGHEGYLTCGMYVDGTPGEIFVVMSKEGSTLSGLMDSFATAMSLALQYGVPLGVLVRKFSHARFEPSGFTTNPQVPVAKSITDYIMRWMALKFLPPEERPMPLEATWGKEPVAEGEELPFPAASPSELSPRAESSTRARIVGRVSVDELQLHRFQEDAPPCHECGAVMVRSGSCYKCYNCGSTSGCS